MKCNILYVIENIEFGGGERVFSQIIRGLNKERFSVFVASNPGGIFEKKLMEVGIKIDPLDMTRRYKIGTISKLKKIIKTKNVQIVHSQGGRADFFARIAARIANVPIIISSMAMLVEGYDVNITMSYFGMNHTASTSISNQLGECFFGTSGRIGWS